MIKTEGWTIALRSSDHRTPAACASCNGPRQSAVVLQTSKRSGNITTILRMKMPYCRPCAARVAGAGYRMMALFSLVTLLAIFLPGAAGLVSVGIAPLLLAILGAVLALVLALPAALIFLPKLPAAPATARGEAVTVTRYDDSRGALDLFCTNGPWAQRFAAANQVQATPTTRYRLVEAIAVGWTLVLAAGMVVLVGYAAEHPPMTRPAVAPTPSAAPVPPGKSPVKPPVAPTPPKKK